MIEVQGPIDRDRPVSQQRFDPLPEPGGAVGGENQALGLTDFEFVQVEPQQCHQGIRPVEGAVDDRRKGGILAAFVVQKIEDQQLGLAPVGSVAVPPAGGFAPLAVGSRAHPATVDGHRHPLAFHRLAKRKPVSQAVAHPRGPQPSYPLQHFDIHLDATPLKLGPGLLQRSQRHH